MRGRRTPTGARRAMSLLVTAFGRFDGGPNCSERLLGRLSEDLPALEALWGGPVDLRLLPVDARTAGALLRRAIRAARPSHLLLMGQAGGRAEISLERTARNRLDLAVPDARGRLGPLGPIEKGGPATRAATWPDLEGAAAAMRAAGVPAEVSDDAGAHLCNETLYLALALAERSAPAFVATFMHLPLMPEQVEAGVPAALRRPGCFAMPLDAMARAVGVFLLHTRGPVAA